MISCQVCRRTMRWHNGQIRRSLNPYPSKVFQDCDSKWEESVAHSIVARSLYPPMKAVYICADQPSPSHFSLAIRRRTIHGRMRKPLLDSGLLFSEVSAVLFVFVAEEFENVGVGHKLLGDLDGKRFGVHPGVV
jgi:hypothetical protein